MVRFIIWAIVLLLNACHQGQLKAANADLETPVYRMAQRVAALRGLERRKRIHWQVINMQQFRAYVHSILDRQYTPGELQREGDAYKALGLISLSLDYQQLMIALAEEQVGGYYDPQNDTFYLADWIDPEIQAEVIVHELTHALQDQHFHIDHFVSRIRGNSDAMLARAALAEGEATWISMAYAKGAGDLEHYYPSLEPDEVDTQQVTAGAHVPHFLQSFLMFPYIKGLNFVNYGRRNGGWKRLNQAYADLPVSTEQILHPERYFDQRDDPVAVRLTFLDVLVEAGWQPIFEDVLGEFVTRHLLSSLGNHAEATRAAAGWDGDKLQVFRRDGELAWVQLSVWDSKQDAHEYAAAMERVMSKQKPNFARHTTPLNRLNMRWTHAQKDRVIEIHQHANQVLIVDNLESAIAERIRQMVW